MATALGSNAVTDMVNKSSGSIVLSKFLIESGITCTISAVCAISWKYVISLVGVQDVNIVAISENKSMYLFIGYFFSVAKILFFSLLFFFLTNK